MSAIATEADLIEAEAMIGAMQIQIHEWATRERANFTMLNAESVGFTVKLARRQRAINTLRSLIDAERRRL